MFLNLLHRRLGIEGRYDGPILVHARGMGDGFPRVLRIAGKTQGTRTVEGDGCADFALDGGGRAL